MSRRRPCLLVCLLVVLVLSSLGPAPARTPRALAAPAPAPAASEIPLSQGKPSFASSSGCGDGGGCLTPDYANDGLDWTFWAAHTNVLPNYPHWWKVDLGASYSIGTLVADWFTSDLYPVQYRYRIEVSDDDQTFTSVLDRTDNTTTGQTVERFSARGRWLRITIENGLLPGGGIGKDLSAYEFRVYQAGPLALEISDSRGEPVEALQLNQDGWPALNADSGAPANPITVTITIQNMTDVRQGYVTELSLGSSNNNARFYVSSSPCDLEFDQFSYTQIDDDCGVQLQPGQTATFQWGLWIQASAAATLVVSAKLRQVDDGSLVDTKQAELGIPQAQIHPVVFIHGILGSMTPRDNLITEEDTMKANLDPFIGSYWPLLDTLQKMGYEWGSSLFVMTYDWRQSNDDSAVMLKIVLEHIRTAVAAPPYVVTSKSDLVVHSMGGLVARSYLQRSPDATPNLKYNGDVRKVVFIASPHKGFPFDYRTWEGMTWHDYLYNAPLLAGGGSAVNTMLTLMDNRIWPALVVKRYQPTDFEFAQACEVHPFGQLTGSIITGYFPSPTDPLKAYKCDWDVIASWAHDPNRGVLSLRQMLPTDDLHIGGAYLYSGSSAFPHGREANRFLADLNANIGQMASNLGLENIFVLYGDGAEETDLRYSVNPPGTALWRYGDVAQVIQATDGNGDDLIPWESTTLLRSGLLGIPQANERSLDAKPPANQGGARHKEIMYHLLTQTRWVPRFIGSVDLPPEMKTDYRLPDWWAAGNFDRAIVVMAECPINLLITDPHGRRVGYDPASGQVVREIPNALYIGPNQEPQLIVITNPVSGTYQVTTSGFDTGTYSVLVDQLDATGLHPSALFGGATTTGQVASHSFSYTPSPPSESFPTTGVLDGFKGADGPLGSNWAGDIQEYEIHNQALAPLGGSGAVYWNSSFGPDQEAFVTLSVIDAGATEIDLLLKGQGNGQCDVLEAWYQPRRGTVQVWTCHNFGAWVQHGSDIPVTFQAGDQFGVRAKADGTVEIYRNGVLVGSVTLDSGWLYRASGGRIGVWTINASSTRLDDFGGGTLP